jgi:DNA-binding transcriptional ArsR family regulator
MIEYTDKNLDATFSALSDPTRRAILLRLARNDLNVTEIAEPYEMSLAAVSKHIGVLTRANLVSQHKQGRIRRCRLEPQALNAVADWIEYYQSFWQSNLLSLENYMEKLKD